MVTIIGRIVYRREGDDGSAQRGRSVIYDCLVFFLTRVVYNVFYGTECSYLSNGIVTLVKNGDPDVYISRIPHSPYT